MQGVVGLLMKVGDGGDFGRGYAVQRLKVVLGRSSGGGTGSDSHGIRVSVVITNSFQC